MIKARPPYRFGLSREQLFAQLGLPELPKKQEAKPEIKEEPVEEPVIEEQQTPEPPAVEEPVAEEVTKEVDKEVAEEVTKEATATPLEALGISEKNISLLQANNINTVEELIAFEGDLEDLPKIGRAAKKAIMEGLTQWQNAQNPTTSTEEN